MTTKVYDPTLTENQVLAQVIDCLRQWGYRPKRRNVGGAYNPNGQYVRYNAKGDPDVDAIIPTGPHRGKVLKIEVKRESHDPSKLRGKKKEHYDRQVAELKRTFEDGGIGIVCNNAWWLGAVVLPAIRDGARFYDDGYNPIQPIWEDVA